MAVKAKATITLVRVNDGPTGPPGRDGKMLYATCSTAAATAAKTATITPTVTGLTLYAGIVVSVKFTVTNTAVSPTLNVNGTGAKAIYYRGSPIAADYLAANRTYMFCYNGTQWEFVGDVNTDSNTYDRTRFTAAVKAAAAIVAGNIIVGNSSGYHHLKTGGAFDISYPILYADSGISSGSTGTNNYVIAPFTVTTTQNTTLTAYKAVYIKGRLNGTTFTPASTAPLTQAVPISADGYYYLYLGMAYSTTAMYLMAEHPLYRYVAGAFRETASAFWDLFAENITAAGTIAGARIVGGTGTFSGDLFLDNGLWIKRHERDATSEEAHPGYIEVFRPGIYGDATIMNVLKQLWFDAAMHTYSDIYLEPEAISVRSLLAGMNDYVVEQGTVEGWYYRKWNSGKMESWNTTGNISVKLDQKYNSVYYTSRVWDCKTGFKAVENIQLQANANDNNGLWLTALRKFSVTNGIVNLTYYIMQPLAVAMTSEVPIQVKVYILGTWK